MSKIKDCINKKTIKAHKMRIKFKIFKEVNRLKKFKLILELVQICIIKDLSRFKVKLDSKSNDYKL
jgi:hypothetical protein